MSSLEYALQNLADDGLVWGESSSVPAACPHSKIYRVLPGWVSGPQTSRKQITFSKHYKRLRGSNKSNKAFPFHSYIHY